MLLVADMAGLWVGIVQALGALHLLIQPLDPVLKRLPAIGRRHGHGGVGGVRDNDRRDGWPTRRTRRTRTRRRGRVGSAEQADEGVCWCLGLMKEGGTDGIGIGMRLNQHFDQSNGPD